MLKRGQATTIFTILILIVVSELLPYGAVLHFGNPEGEPLRETFSYFDLTPYGYANSGPFITAILTCVLIVLAFIGLLAHYGRIRVMISIVSVAALATSLAPIFVSCYSVLGGVISVLLLAVCLISFQKNV